MRSLKSRIAALEARDGVTDMGRPFVWYQGQHLADALAKAGLTLDDKPLLAVRVVGIRKGADGKRERVPDPIYERERHLVA